MRLNRIFVAAALALAVSVPSLAGAAFLRAGPFFGPNETATRCEAITFDWRAAGAPSAPGPHPFVDEDIPGWCDPALDWAWHAGVTTGLGWATSDPLPAHDFTLEVETAVRSAADEFGVDSFLLGEIVRCESRGNPAAVNASSGALGLGQHLPHLWPARAAALYGEAVGPLVDPLDAVVNARVTAWLLATQGTAPWAPYSGHCSDAF